MPTDAWVPPPRGSGSAGLGRSPGISSSLNALRDSSMLPGWRTLAGAHDTRLAASEAPEQFQRTASRHLLMSALNLSPAGPLSPPLPTCPMCGLFLLQRLQRRDAGGGVALCAVACASAGKTVLDVLTLSQKRNSLSDCKRAFTFVFSLLSGNHLPTY